MSQLHIRHLKTHFEKYRPYIDMTDVTTSDSAQRESHFLSRALAAFTLESQAATTAEVACDAVIDGFDDNGIDLVYFDQQNYVLYLIQSKFIHSGSGGPEQAATKKFCDGIRDLIEARYDSFNSKLKRKVPDIQLALDDTRTRIRAIVVFSGNQMSTHAETDLERLRAEINDPTEYIDLSTRDLAQIHGWLTGIVQANDISFEIMLSEWGKTDTPLQAFYGQVNCLEFASIYEKFTARMLNQNIRKFLGDTTINEAIQATISERPELFFFYNNGITLICERVEKTIKGGGDRESGTFKCTGAQIVNGAQTVGSLRRVCDKKREQVAKAKVFIRLISMGSSPGSLASEITRATNTQNKVEKKDFVTLDPRQERLRQELFLENTQYVYKSGEPIEMRDTVTIEEATSALACASGNLAYAILAKKEIGKLWENIDTPPYTELFNDSLGSQRLLRCVQICRKIDDVLAGHKNEKGDARNLAVHGNRVIQHVVLRLLDPAVLAIASAEHEERIAELTSRVFDCALKARALLFPDALLGRLFYNQTKTTEIVNAIVGELRENA